MRYEINKPESELTEGYFTLFLKYFALFIIGWIVGWLILLFYAPSKLPTIARDILMDQLFEHPGFASLVVMLGLIYLFVVRAVNKYNLGLITFFDFNDASATLTLGLLNTMNGKSREKILDYGKIKTALEIKENELFGKQRIYEIFENNILINKINIELTAWCRHPDIENIILQLNNFQRKPNISDNGKL